MKVTPEDVVKFEQTFRFQQTVKMLTNLVEGKQLEITQSHFTSARDFLMTEIPIDNGHPGQRY